MWNSWPAEMNWMHVFYRSSELSGHQNVMEYVNLTSFYRASQQRLDLQLYNGIETKSFFNNHSQLIHSIGNYHSWLLCWRCILWLWIYKIYAYGQQQFGSTNFTTNVLLLCTWEVLIYVHYDYILLFAYQFHYI